MLGDEMRRRRRRFDGMGHSGFVDPATDHDEPAASYEISHETIPPEDQPSPDHRHEGFCTEARPSAVMKPID